MLNIREKKKTTNKNLLKMKLIMALDAMYVENPGMKSDIDSYNCGIHDASEKIKKIL